MWLLSDHNAAQTECMLQNGGSAAQVVITSLQWRHNEHDSVSNHQPHDCLLNRLFGRRSKKTSKLRVTGLCAGNSPVTGEFPAQRASNAGNDSIWWRHHVWICHGRGLFARIIYFLYDSRLSNIVYLLYTTFMCKTLRPRQSDCHFPDDIFKYILFEKCPINNVPALVLIMAWRMPLSEPSMSR